MPHIRHAFLLFTGNCGNTLRCFLVETIDNRKILCYTDLRINRKFGKSGLIMPKYHTRQRNELLGFFEKNTDKSYSAVQIAAELPNISLSAVYRNLAALEAEGKVKRAARSGTREVYYQYIAAPGCRGSIHVSCTSCGRTYHLDHDEAEKLVESVARHDGFYISRSDTVLYGLCAGCKEE